MYGSELALNAWESNNPRELRVHIDGSKLDFASTSTEPAMNHPHIHCWHMDDLFSKYKFQQGGYLESEINKFPNDLTTEPVHEYCLRIAWEACPHKFAK